MRLENLPSEFQEALPILKKIREAGYEAYFVGGSVRDALLKRPIQDVDIASSSYPQETKEIFEKTVDIGIEHGTVLVLDAGGEYEVTTFRTEDTYVDYRRPSQVTFVRSLEEDLKRRDFTINAFALDEEGHLVDLFDGLKDLDQGLLRAVGVANERFEEDALRIMRGFRFQASLGFDLEKKTAHAMAACSPLLEKISIERIFIEFDKLLTARFWKDGLRSLLDSQAYLYLPGLQKSQAGLERFIKAFPDDYVFEGSLAAWSALFLSLNLDNLSSFLKSWKTSNDFRKSVEAIVSIYDFRLERDYSLRDLYFYKKEHLLIAERLRQAQGLETRFEELDRLDQDLTIHNKQEMAISGSLLMKKYGYKPGPHMGQLLKKVEFALVDGQLANEEEAIMAYIREQEHE